MRLKMVINWFDIVPVWGTKMRKGAVSESEPSLSHFPSLPLCFPLQKEYLHPMFPYENLEVYKKAFSANQMVYRFLKTNKNIPGYTRDQLGRASMSIMLNIAEGSAKFSNRDRRNFYVTARGSAFECAALITFLKDENEITNNEFEALSTEYESLSRILYTMIKNLEE